MYIKDSLTARNLPPLFEFSDGRTVEASVALERRNEILKILENEIYGKRPPNPDYLKWEVVEEDLTRECAGKAEKRVIKITFSVNGCGYSFPFSLFMPKSIKNHPFVVIIGFKKEMPNEYIPTEELIDRGIGFASVFYKDITSDDGDTENGFAGVLKKCGYSDVGKIMMWSYCASRVFDYVLENEQTDISKTAVAGHSRLGKTALVTAAFDERFACGYSNDSGCAGAAITREKVGETVEFITKTFPYWFCKKYGTYAGLHEKLPFDQHFLLAAIAPRKVYVASAQEDLWADPESEYLSCCAAGEFWKLYGKIGFVGAERPPRAGDVFSDGNIGYHMRKGVHFFSREDWNKFLDFFLK